MNKKGNFKSAKGNGRPSKQYAWSEEKFVITNPQKGFIYLLGDQEPHGLSRIISCNHSFQLPPRSINKI